MYKYAFKHPLSEMAQAHFECNVLSEIRLEFLRYLVLLLDQAIVVDLKSVDPEEDKGDYGSDIDH
jgi:hypothetical protein